MQFFRYLKDVRGGKGEIIRHFSDDAEKLLLVLKTGLSADERTPDSDDKFAYAEVSFKDWWIDGLSDEARVRAITDVPSGCFKLHIVNMETEGELLCSLVDGEPANMEDTVDSEEDSEDAEENEESVKPKRKTRKKAGNVEA